MPDATALQQVIDAVTKLRHEFEEELNDVEQLIALGDRARAEKLLTEVENKWMGRNGVMRQIEKALWRRG